MRLTKEVREALLRLNEGFETSTHYSAKNITDTRNYKIVDGQLHVRSRGKTSWADSRFDQSFVADDKVTHRFLYEHLADLDTEGVQETLAALAAERASRVPAPAPAPPPGPEGLIAGTDDVVAPFRLGDGGGHGMTLGRPLDVNKAVAWVGVGLTLVTATAAAAPHVPRVWREQVLPRGKRLRGKFVKAQAVDDAETAEKPDAHGPTPDSG